jgi:hypothetical protein
LTTGAAAFEVFYPRYIATCHEIARYVVDASELSALIGQLTERAASTLH